MIKILYRVFVLKDSFKVIYTGLTRKIGNPEDYGKLCQEGTDIFKRGANIDVHIPMDETNVRVSNYGGVSLSISEDSSVIEFEPQDQPKY